jgi:hypothetical protein
MTETNRQDLGASALPSGSRRSDEAPTGLHPSGFDPSRTRDVVHFISAKGSGGNVTACGLDFVYPMRGNGWRVSDMTCPACDRAVCDAAHAAIAMEARQGGDAEERLHAKHDSAAIAQNKSGTP